MLSGCPRERFCDNELQGTARWSNYSVFPVTYETVGYLLSWLKTVQPSIKKRALAKTTATGSFFRIKCEGRFRGSQSRGPIEAHSTALPSFFACGDWQASSLQSSAHFGLITYLTAGNHRIAILSTVLFFVALLMLLATVRSIRDVRGPRR